MGNPGGKYAATRHNIGFRVVEEFAKKEGLTISKKGFSSLWTKGIVEGREVLFLLPQTFMNRSGEVVSEVKRYYRIADEYLMVVHDDLDLPLGRVKRDRNAGTAGHRGVESIVEALGTKDFHRIRVGISRPARKEEVEEFVLSPFTPGEEEQVSGMIEEAENLLTKWILEEGA